MRQCKLLLLVPLLFLQSCLATVFVLPEAPALNRIARLEDQRCETVDITPYLAHSSALVRHRAALCLARLKNADALPKIASRLESESDNRVTEMLIFALGQIGSRNSLALLKVFLYHGNDAIRAAAVDAVGKIRDPSMTGELAGILKNDPSPRVRGEACLALFILGGKREDLSKDLPAEVLVARSAALTNALHLDASAEVQWRAAYALSEIRDPTTEAALRRTLDERNTDFRARMFAVRGLSHMPPTTEIQEVLIRSCSDADWPVVVESIKSLRNYNNLQTAVKLIHLLSPGVTLNTHVRATAARTLGYITEGGASAIKALKQATFDFSLAVEGEAIVALGTIGGLSEDITFLDRIAEHQNPYLRAKAAEAAIEMKDEGMDTLLALALDKSIRVRCKAMEGLKNFPQYKEEIIPVAEDNLKINDMALHHAAAELLAVCESTESLPFLKEAYAMSMGPETSEARQKLFETSIALGGGEDIEFLWTALKDDDFKIRAQAADLLSEQPGLIAFPEPDFHFPQVFPLAGEDYLTGDPNPIAHIFTEKGEFWIELYPDMAPFHVKSFIENARAGLYDTLKFHRIVPNFVVQGLDPRGDGWGTNDIVLRDEINPLRYHTRGMVGAPNSGPDTAGCQIFITLCPTPHLEGSYTIFGKVIAGMNVVHAQQVGDGVLRVTIEE